MANAFVLRNVIVGIDGVDLSDHVREVTVSLTAGDVSTTAMGAGGAGHLAGIRDDRICAGTRPRIPPGAVMAVGHAWIPDGTARRRPDAVARRMAREREVPRLRPPTRGYL